MSENASQDGRDIEVDNAAVLVKAYRKEGRGDSGEGKVAVMARVLMPLRWLFVYRWPLFASRLIVGDDLSARRAKFGLVSRWSGPEDVENGNKDEADRFLTEG